MEPTLQLQPEIFTVEGGGECEIKRVLLVVKGDTSRCFYFLPLVDINTKVQELDAE